MTSFSATESSKDPICALYDLEIKVTTAIPVNNASANITPMKTIDDASYSIVNATALR
jgi:hypothetical protein